MFLLLFQMFPLLFHRFKKRKSGEGNFSIHTTQQDTVLPFKFLSKTRLRALKEDVSKRRDLIFLLYSVHRIRPKTDA